VFFSAYYIAASGAHLAYGRYGFYKIGFGIHSLSPHQKYITKKSIFQ